MGQDKNKIVEMCQGGGGLTKSGYLEKTEEEREIEKKTMTEKKENKRDMKEREKAIDIRLNFQNDIKK